jgi:hypothetical protein
MTSWNTAAPRIPAPQPPTAAPPAPRRHRRAVVVVIGIAAALAVLAAAAVWLTHVRHEQEHERQVARRAHAMDTAYALYQQYGDYPLALRFGVAPVGAGELAMKVCQARDYGRQLPASLGYPNDPQAAGHENAARAAHQAAGTNTAVSYQIASILEADLCDVNG